jgi:hypothetical protein
VTLAARPTRSAWAAGAIIAVDDSSGGVSVAADTLCSACALRTTGIS